MLKFVHHLHCMNFAFFFGRLISKISFVIPTNLKSFSDCCNCTIMCHCLQFPILKMECWLQEFAGSFYDPVFMDCLEAMECGDGFHCSCVGLLVFASIFYKKKQETSFTIQGHILASRCFSWWDYKRNNRFVNNIFLIQYSKVEVFCCVIFRCVILEFFSLNANNWISWSWCTISQ